MQLKKQDTLTNVRVSALLHRKIEKLDNEIAQFTAVNNGVKHPVFEQEFGALKAFGGSVRIKETCQRYYSRQVS